MMAIRITRMVKKTNDYNNAHDNVVMMTMMTSLMILSS